MNVKIYPFLLLTLLCTLPLFGQIEDEQKTGGELQLRTNTSPSIPIICGDATFEYGEVNLGASETYDFQIRNVGTSFLFLYDVDMIGSEDFTVTYDFDFQDGFYVIPAGSQVTFSITFSPATAGEHEVEFQLYSSDSDENPCTMQLEGVGYVPQPGQLRIRPLGSPASYDCANGLTFEFSDLEVGESESRTYLMENVGDEILEFYGIELTGSLDFTLEYDFPFISVPHPIYPGESAAYTITFTPSSPGEKDAKHIILTSDSEKESCSIALEGGGLDPESPHLSIFTPEGDELSCGDTYYIDLSKDYPGPVIYGFYLTFRNYGTQNLEVNGSVGIAGYPGTYPISTFSVDPLQFVFLNTLVYLPGNQVTTLIYSFRTNDPDQPYCTIYVEINQLQNKLADNRSGGNASIRQLEWVTDDAGTKASSTVEAISLPRAQFPERPGFRLFPTVGRDHVQIQVENVERKNYRIISGNGRLVASGQLEGSEQYRLSIASFPAGMYWISIAGYDHPMRFIKVR